MPDESMESFHGLECEKELRYSMRIHLPCSRWNLLRRFQKWRYWRRIRSSPKVPTDFSGIKLIDIPICAQSADKNARVLVDDKDITEET